MFLTVVSGSLSYPDSAGKFLITLAQPIKASLWVNWNAAPLAPGHPLMLHSLSAGVNVTNQMNAIALAYVPTATKGTLAHTL